jgi:hypothetical protein
MQAKPEFPASALTDERAGQAIGKREREESKINKSVIVYGMQEDNTYRPLLSTTILYTSPARTLISGDLQYSGFWPYQGAPQSSEHPASK